MPDFAELEWRQSLCHEAASTPPHAVTSMHIVRSGPQHSAATVGSDSAGTETSLVAPFASTIRTAHRRPLDDAVQDAVYLAQRVTEGCSFASCTTYDGPSTRAASHAEALILDHLQYGSAARPCLEAIDVNDIVQAPHLAAEPGGPRLPTTPLSSWAQCCQCPLRIGGAPTERSAHSTSTPSSRAYSNAAVATARQIAAQLGALLTMATALDQLEAGLATRDMIGQAKAS